MYAMGAIILCIRTTGTWVQDYYFFILSIKCASTNAFMNYDPFPNRVDIRTMGYSS